MELVYTEVFEEWLIGLRDLRARASILTRLERIEDGNFGDHRSLAAASASFRVQCRPGLPRYYTIRQQTVVILLCGGDKASQRRDIRQAQQMAKEV